MHDLTAPFRLIQRNGIILIFDDLESLARATRAAGIVIHRYHVAARTVQDWLAASPDAGTFHEWIVRDDAGAVVTQQMVHPPRSHRRMAMRWMAEVRHAEQRGLPIPRTGKRGGTMHDILRQPRGHGVNAARAWAEQDAKRDPDGDAPIRAPRPKGGIGSVPTAWDDCCRSDYGHRSWKRHRRTRWRRVQDMALGPVSSEARRPG